MLMSWICTTKGYMCLQSFFKFENDQSAVISEDFYDEINLKFIISEYERTNEYKIHYQNILNRNNDGTSSFEDNKDKYVKFIQHQNLKLQSLESKIN